MSDLLLGIDIGTSACKAAVFDLAGNVTAASSKGYEVFYPKEGWAEQNPDDWWEQVCSAVKDLLSSGGIDPARIAAVGIDGQSWSAIPIDGVGNVLCNTPIWMDTRAVDICEEINRTIGADKLFEICGNPVSPSYTLPKILWYKKHRKEMYDKIDKILQSNSYIAYKLTDEACTDISQGYGVQCFDMRKGCYDTDVCKELDVDISILPQVTACHQIVGRVTLNASAECGLLEGTPVVAGGLDAACAALGAGVFEPGETQEQGGQAGGMSICTDEYKADKSLITGYHVIPAKWLLQGGTVGGGGVMKWFSENFGSAESELAAKNGTNIFYELDKQAEAIAAGSDGVVFLPYMAGERSPIWDTAAKGVYYGLDYSKSRAHMLRASLEGVAYSLRHNLETAERAGARVTELRSMGGAANSILWTQIKADVTGKRIVIPSADTATTLGAAMIAGVAIGAYDGYSDAVAKTVRVKRVVEPNSDNFEVYGKRYETYLKLYEQLKPIMGVKG